MYEIKTWEEATKLKKSEIIRIILCILNAILDIVAGIIGKNIAWVLCGLLWVVLARTDYYYLKIDKANEELIDLQEKNTAIQKNIIDALLKETAVEIEIIES